MKILIIGNGHERDKEYLSVLSEAGYSDLEYVDASCGLEQTIQIIKQKMIPDDTIFVKGTMSSRLYLSILLAFRTNKRAFHSLFLQKHQQQFCILDAAMNVAFTDPEVFAEVIVTAAAKQLLITGSMPTVYLFEAAVNDRIAQSHKLYVQTRDILKQAGLEAEIRQLDTMFLDKSCDAKAISHPAENKLIACADINSADAIMKSFLINHWVGRGYVFNLFYDAILNSRSQDIRSTIYCIKELELIRSKEGKSNVN